MCIRDRVHTLEGGVVLAAIVVAPVGVLAAAALRAAVLLLLVFFGHSMPLSKGSNAQKRRPEGIGPASHLQWWTILVKNTDLAHDGGQARRLLRRGVHERQAHAADGEADKAQGLSLIHI